MMSVTPGSYKDFQLHSSVDQLYKLTDGSEFVPGSCFGLMTVPRHKYCGTIKIQQDSQITSFNYWVLDPIKSFKHM